METPTIHSNGTGFNSLMREATNAVTAGELFLIRLTEMTVHGRDYYVQKDQDAIVRAREEYRDRMMTVQKVIGELLEYQLKIFEQKNT